MIAFVVDTAGGYHVWISRDDGATFEEQRDTLHEWPWGSTLEVDADGHVGVSPPSARPAGTLCAAHVGDTTYRVRKGRMEASDDNTSRGIRIPDVDLADPSLSCTIVGNEHALYARFITRTRNEIVRIDGAKVRRVGSGFHLEPMAVDSHGELLVVRYADALMRGTVELATRDTPPGCFAYEDEVAPMRETHTGTLVDGNDLRSGMFCDAPDRLVVADRTTVYSLARTEGAHVRRARITRETCHRSCDPRNHHLGCDLSSGCRFESALGAVETSHPSGPLDVDLVDGPRRLPCKPAGADHALVTCSTRTRLAFVQATSCPGVRAPQDIKRLELVLVGRGTDTSTRTAIGELVSRNLDGTVWAYHFAPDIDLTVTTAPRPAVSLQIAGTREPCIAFAF
jgi:hypothetical protein